MSSGGGGFTVRGDARYVRESLDIEAGLARALDDGPCEPFEQTLNVDTAAVTARADRLAAHEGPQAARQLLLEEARRYTRWLRAVDLGLAGNDGADGRGFTEQLRGTLAHLALSAALYGQWADAPAEQLAAEIAAAGALESGESGESGRFATARLLSDCYVRQGRPDLALSLLVRSPPGDCAAEHLVSVLNAARATCAAGHVRRVAEVLRLTDRRFDPTGLARDLMSRLVNERMPTAPELTARGAARSRAADAGDWAALRDLALSDVTWLDDAVLWRSLSAILSMNGAHEQSLLAQDAGDLVARVEAARVEAVRVEAVR